MANIAPAPRNPERKNAVPRLLPTFELQLPYRYRMLLLLLVGQPFDNDDVLVLFAISRKLFHFDRVMM